ncbi:FAD-dependent monooxygenase [Actinocrispum wychmicini]|uniref:2-polyprenyl-6-methoxyphenol hydroxylase-like FAD-dependent oxidoreductase n=1 Tax=Actinocrispum wychmicini TaxID=1213861 RepID=A0A4V2S810_9PSEU|nr:FAD-dependent monooxygenase [Actinocrispum wychmicini]TCO62030.1 2-polyprenyl-6-methoxyphenol hydroxylase-like FAD-dependent oxidoreductase [Actinocrispum wychmicini]
MSETNIDVLVVGAGPVGLATGLFLGRHGVRALVAERHPGTTIYPRATGLAVRTREILREAGLAESVAAAGSAMASTGGKLIVDTLAGTDLATAKRIWPRQSEQAVTVEHSPTADVSGICPQDRLEPILLDAARAAGARVQFETELAGFDGGVATLRSPGGEQVVHPRYVVAADGAASGLRESLGIGTIGPGPLGGAVLSVLFEADLANLIRGHEFVVCEIGTPAAPGLLLAINNSDRWVFNISYDPDTASPADYPEQRCAELIRTAIGRPGLDVRVLARNPWVPSAFSAEAMRKDMVFLAGDAAHVMPPLGAYGLNTGIADAHNIAWKLAAVINGMAGPGLLDSYEQERLPVARFTVEQAMLCQRNPRLHWDLAGSMAEREQLGMADPQVVSAGYRYRSRAVAESHRELASLSDFAANVDGSPGGRVPHVRLARRGERLSTLDLCGRDFVLLGGASAHRWADAAAEAGRRLGMRVQAYQIGRGCPLVDLDGNWRQAAGISAEGAVLVRPDGFVAWRSTGRSPIPEQTLHDTLRTILDRS